MNNTASLSQIYSALAIALLSATTISLPSRAQSSTTFFCGTANESPATIAKTAYREVPMIVWNSPSIVQSEEPAQKRCEDVANRLQNYFNSGTLKYITTGFMNGQTVVCVAQEENGGCSGDPLFALNLSPNTTARDSLQRIFRVRVASAAPISETATPVYISLDKFLNGEYTPMGTPNRRRPQSPNSSESPKPSQSPNRSE